MSYLHKPHIQPLEHRTPFQLLHHHAQATPDKQAFVFRDANSNKMAITFKEYERKSEVLAAALLEIGLVRGDRVLLMLPTNDEFVYIHMALNMIGAFAVIVEQDYYAAVFSANDLACVIANIDYSVSINMEKTVQELRAIFQQGTLKAGIITGHYEADHDLLTYPKVYAYEKLFEMTQMNEECRLRVQRAEAEVQFDDPTFVLFTSGSTGIPKPIKFTNQAFMNAARAIAYNVAIDKDTILFCDGPFDWISGMGFGIGVVLLLGSTLVSFPPRLAFKGGLTATIMKIIEEEKCSHAILLMYFLQDMVSSEKVRSIDLSQLKYCMVGGQPTSMTLLRKILSLYPHVIIRNIYGSTETSLISSQEITKDSLDTLDLGLMDICPGFEAKIVDEEGRVVPHNTPGELCLRATWVSFMAENVMKEVYEPNTQKDVSLGWHHTKDLATITPEGKLKLHGRIDNVIKCACESIFPIEIEGVLQEHPLVDKVIAVGVPDQRLYQKICACIILKAGFHDDQEVLRAKFEEFSKGKFGKATNGLVLKPHYYVFCKDFPLTRTGKLNRKGLRERAARQLGRINGHYLGV